MSMDGEFTAEQQDRLAAALAALPRETAPARDLWPAIAARIASEPAVLRPAPMRRWMPLALAASLVIAFCGGIAGAYFGYGLAARRFATIEVAAPATDRVELAYADARAGYLRQLALASSRLDAPTRQMLERNLMVIDEAVRQVHAALANDPHNPMYLDALLMTRASEIDMLEDVANFPTQRL